MSKKTKQKRLTPPRKKKERPKQSIPKTKQLYFGKKIPKVYIEDYDYERKGKDVHVDGYWRKKRGKNKPKRKIKQYKQTTID